MRELDWQLLLELQASEVRFIYLTLVVEKEIFFARKFNFDTGGIVLVSIHQNFEVYYLQAACLWAL